MGATRPPEHAPADGADQHQPLGELVLVTAFDVACALCGIALEHGTEARRWIGVTVVHVTCAETQGR